jgi:hypothetical protein
MDYTFIQENSQLIIMIAIMACFWVLTILDNMDNHDD